MYVLVCWKQDVTVAQAGLELSIFLPQPLRAGIPGMNHHTYLAFIFMCLHEPAAFQVLKGPKEHLPLQKHASKIGAHPATLASKPESQTKAAKNCVGGI